MKKIALIVMAVLMIAGAVQAFEITKNLSVDAQGVILKPFDVQNGTESNIDTLNVSTQHGLFLMDAEAGIRYKIGRVFVGYETATKIDKKERSGIEAFVLPNVSVRLEHVEHTLYGHDSIVKRYTAIGTGFKF